MEARGPLVQLGREKQASHPLKTLLRGKEGREEEKSELSSTAIKVSYTQCPKG